MPQSSSSNHWLHQLMAANAAAQSTQPRKVPNDVTLGSASLKKVGLPKHSRPQLKNVRLTERLGSGLYGVVYRGTYNGSMDVAVKFVKYSKDFDREVAMQRRFHELGLPVPKVYGSYVYKGVGVVIMSRVDGTVRAFAKCHHGEHGPQLMEAIALKLKGLVQWMQQAGVVHGDLHLSNLAYKRTGQGGDVDIMLIDFGRSLVIPPGISSKSRAFLKTVDAFMVWHYACKNFSLGAELNAALRAVHFPGSVLFADLGAPEGTPKAARCKDDDFQHVFHKYSDIAKRYT